MPDAGTSTASMFDEEMRVDLMSLAYIISLRATDVFSEYSLLMPARSKDPQRVRGAICTSRIGVSGQAQGTQMGGGGD